MPETQPAPPRPEVRIHLYGLVRVTKRGYFIMLAFEIVLLAVPTTIAMLAFRKPNLPKTGFARSLELLPAIVIIAAVWLVLEAVIVLRRFRREEAKQRGS